MDYLYKVIPSLLLKLMHQHGLNIFIWTEPAAV
jgi:hypothetical protein